MRILYSSSLCSESKYNELYNETNNLPGQQIQKYHRLITEGLKKNEVEIETISAIPMTRKISKKLFFSSEKESRDLITYNYIPIINIPIIKHILMFISTFIKSYIFLNKSKSNILICDVLNTTVSSSSLLAAKILRRKSIGIVTDMPGYLIGKFAEEKGLIRTVFSWFTTKLNKKIMDSFDSYILITEQTNDLMNKKKKPYVIIEGLVDIKMKSIKNTIKNKDHKKIVLYAGSLKRIYGISNLVEAFLKANVYNSELHIYGTGNFAEDLFKLAHENSKIKYFGTVPNIEIIQKQLKATLLVNPRPTKEEYVKYSFPSKNMEYMVSGTPTLTTNLPGMPKEYKDYVYLIKDETLEGLTDTLYDVLLKDKEELQEIGEKAKKFVLQDKNNIVQAAKIINMIKNFKEF